jgi:hypothetical protein
MRRKTPQGVRPMENEINYKIDSSADFQSKFDKLKNAVGAKTDSEFATTLNIKQKSLSAAKRKKHIPNTWIKKVSAINQSENHAHGAKSSDILKTSEILSSNSAKKSAKKPEVDEIEDLVSEYLVQLSLIKHNGEPIEPCDSYKLNFHKLIIRMVYLPNILQAIYNGIKENELELLKQPRAEIRSKK